MEDEQPLQTILNKLDITLDQGDYSSAKQMVIQKINDLIQNDFQRLVSILYTIDVSEKKLKQLLKENTSTDAAVIITELMIERQLQKVRSRQEYKKDENISDEEGW